MLLLFFVGFPLLWAGGLVPCRCVSCSGVACVCPETVYIDEFCHIFDTDMFMPHCWVLLCFLASVLLSGIFLVCFACCFFVPGVFVLLFWWPAAFVFGCLQEFPTVVANAQHLLGIPNFSWEFQTPVGNSQQ